MEAIGIRFDSDIQEREKSKVREIIINIDCFGFVRIEFFCPDGMASINMMFQKWLDCILFS
jgi:hypothetical protein